MSPRAGGLDKSIEVFRCAQRSDSPAIPSALHLFSFDSVTFNLAKRIDPLYLLMTSDITFGCT